MSNQDSTDFEVPKVGSVFDGEAVKTMLDEAVAHYLSGKIDSQGARVDYKRSTPDPEVKISTWEIDYKWTNYKLLLSVFCVLLAALSHFWPQPFPENYWLLSACFLLYLISSCLIQWILSSKEQNVILTTKPRLDSKIGLIAKSYTQPFSSTYRLELIAFRRTPHNRNAILKSVERTFSITSWFSESGKFAKPLFIENIDQLQEELPL